MDIKALILLLLIGQEAIIEIEIGNEGDRRFYAYTDNDRINVFYYSIYFEDDPKYSWKAEELSGRRATIDKEKLIVSIKGIPPRRYRELLKQPPRYSALISGLKNPRKAATDILIRRGESSIPYLLYGLQSSDLEVRDRCELALEAIRLGY